jgi:hypothetical protein
MTKETLAAQLTGREYGNEIDPLEEKDAKDNGLVVVFGYSDDGVEFKGAINEEVGGYGGATIEFTKAGIFRDEDDDEVLEKYSAQVPFNKIVATYSPWVFKTEIPHTTFDIMEDGELSCRGIVFSVNDLK